MTWRAPEVERVDEPLVGDERTLLEGRLDFQRSTLLWKCAGLTGEQLALRSAPPSTLSLLGLVRHITDAERAWFRRRFAGQQLGRVYQRADDDSYDEAFDDLDPDSAQDSFARLVEEVRLCREAVAPLPLDTIFVHDEYGEMSLAWAYGHMITEYARHLGHADILRERIDGATGG